MRSADHSLVGPDLKHHNSLYIYLFLASVKKKVGTIFLLLRLFQKSISFIISQNTRNASTMNFSEPAQAIAKHKLYVYIKASYRKPLQSKTTEILCVFK